MTSDVKQMTPEEIHQRIIELGFAGDDQRFATFCRTLHEDLPPGTGVVLRGSVITNERWADGQPFDADGPGTSDLDVTLVGDQVMNCWAKESFYIPGLHTKPLSDKDPDCAQELNLLRQALQQIARRPVNFQATNNLILFARDVLLDQPYFLLFETNEAPAS
ncbi:MAG: hypothetical protein U0350_00465 [Caldilineaceae bacterium]